MLTGVVTFLLLFIALLAVPVTLTFKMTWQQDFQSDVSLLWLFGLVHARLPTFKTTPPSLEGKQLVQETGRLKRLPGENAFSVVRQKTFRRRIFRFISDCWRALQKKDVNLRVRVGLGDPADTGQLWAIVGPMAGILANVQQASIEIEPEFFDATFQVNSSGNIRLIPLQMIYLTAGLLLSPPIWQGIIKTRQAGK